MGTATFIEKFSLLGLLFLVRIVHECRGCLEEERMALLDIKAFVSSSDGFDEKGFFSSWVADATSDCCKWEKVSCDSYPGGGHVVELSLDNMRQLDLPSYSIYDHDNIWYFNMSLFQPFKELQTLNLSFNVIGGWVQNEDSRNLLRLEELQMLDLTANKLNKSSLQSLSSLTALKNLTLRQNQFEGPFPAQELSTFENMEMLDLSSNILSVSLAVQDFGSLSKLSKLKYLYLSDNQLEKDIVTLLGSLSSLELLDLSYNQLGGPLSLRELGNLINIKVLKFGHNSLNGTLPIQDLLSCGKLEILDLSWNDFTGSIPPYVGALSSLKALSLTFNNLNGSLPIPGLCGLERLQEIDLSHNSFEGMLPPCLNNLTSLRHLDLSSNQFTGVISTSSVTSLTSLEYIDLSQNHFEGIFSFSSIENHSKLKVLILASDSNKLKIETANSSWDPLFQLEALVLSNLDLNVIPTFLLHQHQLRLIDLSHNELKGDFPSWLLENNPELRFLNLRNNNLVGGLNLPPYPVGNIVWVDISNNHFNGQLPEDLGDMLPNLQYLNFSKNGFEGNIPPSVGKLTNLDTLDLSFNNFSGEVPEELVTGCTSLEFLRLSNNRFHGEIFSARFNLSNLIYLELRNNQLMGSLSDVKFELAVLDISNNFFTGKIPSWISNVGFVLAMRKNFFEGHFPCEQLLSVFYLDLSHNFLSGALPSCLDTNNIQQIHLEGNKFRGPILTSLFNSPNLMVLNLRDNSLSGNIPAQMGNLPNLGLLLLGKNNLSGLIPEQLCLLNGISIMELSSNFLSGPVPSCFSNIVFGMRTSGQKPAGGYIFSSDISLDTHRYQDLLQNKMYLTPKQTVTHLEIALHVEFNPWVEIAPLEGDISNYMFGLDLSWNNLVGEIPQELGYLSWIQALNLSHNRFTGPIPASFSNLSQIKSLDLSYNSLSREIPSELINLKLLEFFDVSHNNLSGRIPIRNGHLGTFKMSGYEGNPFLCGLPLEKNCTTIMEAPPLRMTTSDETEGTWYKVAYAVFLLSVAAIFIAFFLVFIALQLITPRWQGKSGSNIKDSVYSSNHLLFGPLPRLSTKPCKQSSAYS